MDVADSGEDLASDGLAGDEDSPEGQDGPDEPGADQPSAPVWDLASSRSRFC